MQQIEPTGFPRLEWYLAKILAALLAEPGEQYDWREQLIGYEEQEQTLSEALEVFNSIGK